METCESCGYQFIDDRKKCKICNRKRNDSNEKLNSKLKNRFGHGVSDNPDYKSQRTNENSPVRSVQPIRCVRCRSEQLSANSKGFGVGKAATGAVLLGPVGLLGGFMGGKKTIITCLRCGHKWEAGKY